MVDRYLRRPNGRRLRLFLSEFSVPTDHIGYESNFYVTRRTAAQWVSSALRITRRWWRIYTFGWIALYDEAPRPSGDQVNRGLLDYLGRREICLRGLQAGLGPQRPSPKPAWSRRGHGADGEGGIRTLDRA